MADTGPVGTGGIPARRLAVNIGALFTSNVVNRATSFLVYAMVAAFLGARELGQLALAMSLFFLLNRFVLLGLETLTTREIAQDRDQTGRYLSTAGVMVAVSAVLSLPVAWGVVALMGYSDSTGRVILFLFLGMLPFALGQLTEATFVAWERSKLVAFSNSPVWIVQTGVAFLLLRGGRGVDAIALSIAAAYAAILCVHGLLLFVTIRPSIRFDRHHAPRMLQSSLPFLGISGMNAIRSNANILLLSRFSSEAAVGLFAAANQLLTPMHLVFQATGMGAFPAMVRQFKSQASRVSVLAGRLLEFTLAMAVPAATGLFVLAGPILLLIFRDAEFEQSAVVLRILAWTTVNMALTAVLGQVLWATNREGTAFRIAVMNTVAMVVIGSFLIWRFDVEGAALASLVVGMLYVVQHYFPLRRVVPLADLVGALWKPLVASAAMAVFLLSTPGAPLWLRISAGAAVYLVVLFVLYLLRAGGYSELMNRVHSAGVEA